MIRALITGTIYGEPQARTSQAGKDQQHAIAAEEPAGLNLELARGIAALVAGEAIERHGPHPCLTVHAEAPGMRLVERRVLHGRPQRALAYRHRGALVNRQAPGHAQ